MEETESKEMTFWDHLDELRKMLFHVAIAVILLAAVAFLCKDLMFNILLAPRTSDFILYRFINWLGDEWSISSLHIAPFHIELINIQLASQFFIHMSASLYAGLLLASPYIIYKVFGFISPALYKAERNISIRLLISAFLLFVIGILLNYFLIFPLSFRFLAFYQVSEEVVNKISLSSYMGTFTTLSLLMGAAFEIPVLAYFLAKLRFIHAGMLKKYRKHALVAILILAAVITPTSDIFTLLLVSVPMYLLYELSIRVVYGTRK